MTATTAASPAKLNNGSWGARVQAQVNVGDIVTITTRAGKSWDAMVTRVVWTDGKISLCATESAAHSRPARSGRGRRTGCSCGSREDAAGDLLPSRSNCWQCEHDA